MRTSRIPTTHALRAANFLQRLLVATVFVGAVSAHAEMRECKGVWTNKPCEEAPQHALKESSSVESPLQREKSQRSLWLHDLEMKSIKAKREFKVDVDIGDVQVICHDLQISTAGCRKAIADKDALLEERITAAKTLALKKAQLEAQTTPQQQPLQVIVQNNDHFPRRSPTPYPPPVLNPTPRIGIPLDRPMNRVLPPAGATR